MSNGSLDEGDFSGFRLKVYNEEFETFEEIESIVRVFNEDVNNEYVGDFIQTPVQKLEKESEYLSPIPAFEKLSHFFYTEKEYKVSNSSGESSMLR